jgi:hypothetical protein
MNGRIEILPKTGARATLFSMKRSEKETEMFSKAEMRFLEGPKTVNENYERVLLHRIFKKLDNFRYNVLPVLASNPKTLMWAASITENCNGITENSNYIVKTENLKNRLFSQNKGEKVVGRAGIEPATFCTSSRCPTKLDDRPFSNSLIESNLSFFGSMETLFWSMVDWSILDFT